VNNVHTDIVDFKHRRDRISYLMTNVNNFNSLYMTSPQIVI